MAKRKVVVPRSLQERVTITDDMLEAWLRESVNWNVAYLPTSRPSHMSPQWYRILTERSHQQDPSLAPPKPSRPASAPTNKGPSPRQHKSAIATPASASASASPTHTGRKPRAQSLGTGTTPTSSKAVTVPRLSLHGVTNPFESSSVRHTYRPASARHRANTSENVSNQPKLSDLLLQAGANSNPSCLPPTPHIQISYRPPTNQQNTPRIIASTSNGAQNSQRSSSQLSNTPRTHKARTRPASAPSARKIEEHVVTTPGRMLVDRGETDPEELGSRAMQQALAEENGERHTALRQPTSFEHFTARHAEFWHQRGYQYWLQRELLGAIQCYKQGLKLNPEHRGCLHSLGCCLEHMEIPADALKVFQRLVQLCPEDSDLHYDIALCSYQTEDFQLAVDHLTTAINLTTEGKTPSDYLVLRALAYRQLGKFALATKDYRIVWSRAGHDKENEVENELIQSTADSEEIGQVTLAIQRAPITVSHRNATLTSQPSRGKPEQITGITKGLEMTPYVQPHSNALSLKDPLAKYPGFNGFQTPLTRLWSSKDPASFTSADRKSIVECLQQHAVFKRVPTHELESRLWCVTVSFFRKGHVVFLNESVHFILRGTLSLQRHYPVTHVPITLAKFVCGQHVGDGTEVVTSNQRDVWVVAEEDTEVVSLPRDQWEHIWMLSRTLKGASHLEFLRSVGLLQPLCEQSLAQLAYQLLKTVTVGPHEEVSHPASAEHSVCIITKGLCRVVVDLSQEATQPLDETAVDVQVLGRGDYFGEDNLLGIKSFSSLGRIVADHTGVELLVLSKSDWPFFQAFELDAMKEQAMRRSVPELIQQSVTRRLEWLQCKKRLSKQLKPQPKQTKTDIKSAVSSWARHQLMI